MGSYYLDIETTGLDPKTDKIITIQYAGIQRGTGRQSSPLTILKEWELGEQEMLETFIQDTGITSTEPFDFVPIGYNLKFEHKFLSGRTSYHNIDKINLISRPFLDLHPVGILMNNGEFRGSGLDNMTGKKQNGSHIIPWYESRQYDLIIDYIHDEAREFIKWLRWLYGKMPDVREQWIHTIHNVIKVS